MLGYDVTGVAIVPDGVHSGIKQVKKLLEWYGVFPIGMHPTHVKSGLYAPAGAVMKGV